MSFRYRSSPLRQARWNLLEAEENAARVLAAGFDLHPAVARILAARGWATDHAGLPEYLSPMLKNLRSPYELQEIDRAVERTLEAIKRGESICIYGDYDVDGITSTALLVGTLRYLGADPTIVIPHRFNDGYGMNLARVEEIASGGCRLIITVDTGVSAIAEIRRAAELGVDVIVTDHHLAGDELPAAQVFVNPNRVDAPYEHGRLCGVGVAFKFAHGLLKASDKPQAEAKAFLMEQLDLVALGTVADVVPLLGENRLLVRHGLEVIGRTKRPGLRALMDVAGLKGKTITPESVGFAIGPRLNAAGRTDDATLALRLLLTQDASEGARIAAELDDLNRERQEIEREILESSVKEVEAHANPNAVVVGKEGWHLGVVGIVAARLTERYNLPAFVLCIDDDMAKGSARSVPGFDVHEALTACATHLVTFGGHASAAGLKLHARSLPSFREAMNDHAARIFTTMDRTTCSVDVDAEIRAEEITWAFYDNLQKLQPFGEGNPAPLLLLRHVESIVPPRIVGKNHLKLRLRAQGSLFDSIGFGLAHLRDVFEGPADILFRPCSNTFNGRTSLELELVDGRPAR